MIDAATVLAAPFAAQILGDFGAEVIKVEHPTKPDSFRSHGASKNGEGLWAKMLGRNKRSIALDLHDDAAVEVFKRLVVTADVLIENFRPGTLERWGIGPEILHSINPDLIIVRLTGFGQTGPYAPPGIWHVGGSDVWVCGAHRRSRWCADVAAIRAC